MIVQIPLVPFDPNETLHQNMGQESPLGVAEKTAQRAWVEPLSQSSAVHSRISIFSLDAGIRAAGGLVQRGSHGRRGWQFQPLLLLILDPAVLEPDPYL